MPEAHLTGTIAGRYEIVDRLGAGGMGEVYRARDTKLQRDVAIKRLAPQLAVDPKYRERMLREARAAARVSHQGLAALYDVLEEGDDLFLVMEYVEGQTLRDAIANDDLDVDEALQLLIECSAALAAAHKSRIVHRDITPANIMVTPEGRAKILDFGLAHAAVAADPDGSTLSYLDGDSGVAGTPPYMAPEVLLGKKTDYRADIFSLGVVAYQLLTTKNPFFASTPTAISDRILHLDPPPIVQVNPAVPPQLEPIVRKMLAKNPEHRYATMDDVRVDLRNVRRMLQTSPSLTDTGTYPTDIPTAPATKPRWPAALAATAVIFAGFWAWAYWPASPPALPVGTVSADASDNMILAVLALHGESDSPENIALSDGLGSTLAAKLGRLTRNHEFQLVPSLSVRSRGVDTVEEARVQFGCDRVLTVSLRREGEQLQANLGLVDARTGTQIIGDQVDGTMSAIFDFEATVADKVLRMLQLELRPTDTHASQAGTASVGAREFYLSGVGYQERAENEAGVRLAMEQYRQALRNDPGFATAHAALGQAYIAMYGFTQESTWLTLAAEECDEAIRLDDLEALGYSCRGQYETTTGSYEAAIDAYEQARGLAPTNDAIVRHLAAVLRSANRPEEAEQTFVDAIALRPHYAANYERLGTFYLLSGRVPESIDAYEQAVQLAPDSYRNHGNLGNAYYYNEDRVAAERAYRDSIALNPTYAPPLSNVGTILFYRGNYGAAAGMFRQAAELEPTRFDYWGNLGDAHWFAGAEMEAGTAFEHALALTTQTLSVNPNQAEVQAQAAYYLSMLSRPEAAGTHIAAALALEPDSGRVARKIAQALQVQGDTDGALRYLRLAIDRGYPRQEIRDDPLFDDLDRDERFEAIISG